MSSDNSRNTDTAESFFGRLTGLQPFGYQRRLAEGESWPDLLDVPTGLGKTAAVIVAWLWKRLRNDPQTGRRLVYCLPMRSLVEQTFRLAGTWCAAAAPSFEAHGIEPPQAAVLMGGETTADWDVHPGRPQVIVGTQDMLLSRALGRGYGMSRYRWPMHFGLLNSDSLWVFDETQLMGVGVETSAQLQAFREALGSFGPARSLWMSATLGRQQLATVDHPQPAAGWSVHGLSAEERSEEQTVRSRTLARKHLIRAGDLALAGPADDAHHRRVAEAAAAAASERGGLTLVVVNRVDRAREVYRALQVILAGSDLPTALLHSRFRARDRARHFEVLSAEGDRIVVATQVVEAGVDVSARTLFTELAPWPSLVQRFGRCNRYGEAEPEGTPAQIHWIPLLPEDDGDPLALPYEAEELAHAAELLERLDAQGGDAGPEALAAIPYEAPPKPRPVLRRRDLLDLFDSSPDLLGYDLDVSRFVRDAGQPDVQFFWRDFTAVGDRPPSDLAEPAREELCRVSMAAASSFLRDLEKARRKERSDRAHLLWAWRWSPIGERWDRVRSSRDIRPGESLLLHSQASGYDAALGWTGDVKGEPVAPEPSEDDRPPDSMDGNESTRVGRWILLTDHLQHVEAQTRRIAAETGLDADGFSDALTTAARWHDVGKAHEQFQRRLLAPLEDRPDRSHPGPGPWAKSDHGLRARGVRPYFRHELASALAWLAHPPEPPNPADRQRDLVAFLIAAHHGKVRLALRSVPGEEEPEVPDTLFARGVWDGDVLPALEIPRESIGPTRLDLSPMRMGEGSWTERALNLRDDPELGPFRIAYLETLLRAADERASEAEKAHGAGEPGDA